MELHIGRYQSLPVREQTSAGFILGEGEPEVLLPRALASAQVAVGLTVRVFIFEGSGGTLMGSMRPPKAMLGEFAYLKCVSVGDVGAFMDWGLPKDLFVPYALQHAPLVAGESYVVHVGLDSRGERIVGSTSLGKQLDYDASDLREGDAVDVLVYSVTGTGAQVVIDQQYAGVIHLDSTSRRLEVGESLSGFVAGIRAKQKTVVTLTPPRAHGEFRDAAQDAILLGLEAAGGFLPLHDKSSPEAIFDAFGLSKKVFKRGLGGLYKARAVVIESGGIRLVDDD